LFLTGSPADKADLEVADEILEINGSSLVNSTHTDVIAHIHNVRFKNSHYSLWCCIYWWKFMSKSEICCFVIPPRSKRVFYYFAWTPLLEKQKVSKVVELRPNATMDDWRKQNLKLVQGLAFLSQFRLQCNKFSLTF
jgi:hypothetical protein